MIDPMALLSRAEKLLVAASRLAAKGSLEFTLEDLVVAAFEAFPADFSLKGHPEHPDSNPVYTLMMGRKAPPIVKGWLLKTGAKTYQMTPKGLEDLRSLEQQDATAIHAKLERKLGERIGALLVSPAFEFWRAGNEDEITFHHFCRFVGLTARDKWQRVMGKIQEVEHTASKAREIGERGEGYREFVYGRNVTFSSDDLRSLGAALAAMQERFAPQMEEWKRKSDS